MLTPELLQDLMLLTVSVIRLSLFTITFGPADLVVQQTHKLSLITLNITLILTGNEKHITISVLYSFDSILTDLILACLNSTELGRLPRVKTCANLMRKICYNNKDRMMAGMICGGWDPYEGGQVYEIPLGGTMMQQKFALGGSGSSYIYGLVDSTYREGMTKEECKTFVKTAISHAMARDGSSGGVIRLVVIDQSGIEKEVVLGEAHFILFNTLNFHLSIHFY